MLKPYAKCHAILMLCCLVAVTTGALRYGMEPAFAQARPAKGIDWNDVRIKWHSFEVGLREAERTRTPMLVLFYADWCPHCAAYSRLFREPDIVALSQSLVMVKVDRDKSPELNARYAPDGGYVPRTMVLNANGSLIASIHGSDPNYRYFLYYETKKDLLAVMKRAASYRVSVGKTPTLQ